MHLSKEAALAVQNNPALNLPKFDEFGLTASPVAGVSLRDEHVTIGPVAPADLGALFVWLNDADSARLDLPFRPLDCIAFKGLIEQIAKDATQVLFAIRKLREPQIIGFTVLRNLQMVHRSAELGIRIGAEAERGKGYGGRAVALVLNYAWNSLNLHRVSLTVLAHNERAIASYLASGFVHEGVLKQAAFIDGKWCDVAVMAVLRPEAPRLH
jgi:RimJ/RimL family protein N-acetyltransferase